MGFKRSWVQIPPARYQPAAAPKGMFHVYVLRSRNTGRRYVGSCENIKDRLERHNAGHSKATPHGIPWVLVHRESFSNRAEATRKERFYKTGRGRDELDRLDL